MPKAPDPADIYAGGKLRFQRQLKRISQTSLADALGITFQQVQKYEKGVNRISASRLQTVARILGVPVSFFFDEGIHADRVTSQTDHGDEMLGFLASKEVLQLSRHFLTIRDVNCRQAVLALIQALGEASSQK